MRRILLFCLMIASVSVAYAQRSDRSFVRKGNRMFKDSLFIKAEENYLKAVDMNPQLYEGNFNLGNAYTAQQKPNEAVDQYRKTANALEMRKKELMDNPDSNSKELERCKEELAMTYHNTGVVYHMCEQYDKAVDAYKQALRNNPSDDETRYNLILAQRMLKQQQQQENQQQQQQDQQQSGQQNQQQQQSQDSQDSQKQEAQQQESQQQDAQQQDAQEQDAQEQEAEEKEAQAAQRSEDEAEKADEELLARILEAEKRRADERRRRQHDLPPRPGVRDW